MDLVAMAMKGYSIFSKAPWLESCYLLGITHLFLHNELVHLPYIAVATNTRGRLEGEEQLLIGIVLERWRGDRTRVVYWPTTRPGCQNRKCTYVNNRCIRSRNIRIITLTVDVLNESNCDAQKKKGTLDYYITRWRQEVS